MKSIINKKDYPSGTALMLGKGIADGKKKTFTVYSEKIFK